MPFTIIAFLRRKPGTTPQQFKDYYENHHLPLVKEITGCHFPSLHKRYYVTRTAQDPSSAESDTSNTNYPAIPFGSSTEEIQFDVYVEIVYEDEEQFQAFMVKLNAHTEQLAIDEAKFLDTSKIQAVKVDEPRVTAV